MQTLAEHLAAAPFTLVMSSGFFGFFAHAGMLSALEDNGLLPVRVGGSSAGALVGGLWASGRSTGAIASELSALRRSDFWDPKLGLGLLRGDLFRALLEQNLGAKHFDQCRVPAFACAYDVVSRRVRAFDRGPLAPALHASCAVPGMFQPVFIEGRPYVDGGVSDRPGLSGAGDEERVFFHHLSSRSPWRAKGSDALKIPTRGRMTTLVIADLPRVGPFRLEVGRLAFARAREATREALSRVVTGPVVTV